MADVDVSLCFNEIWVCTVVEFSKLLMCVDDMLTPSSACVDKQFSCQGLEVNRWSSQTDPKHHCSTLGGTHHRRLACSEHRQKRRVELGAYRGFPRPLEVFHWSQASWSCRACGTSPCIRQDGCRALALRSTKSQRVLDLELQGTFTWNLVVSTKTRERRRCARTLS